MDLEVFQMFHRIPSPGIALDLGDFEFLGQAVLGHSSGEWGTGTRQESVHRNSFALSFFFISRAMLAHLLSNSATFLFKLSGSPAKEMVAPPGPFLRLSSS
jgi:hypothetical protein